MITTVLRSTTQ